jgi:PAS domain S-box-containing protein
MKYVLKNPVGNIMNTTLEPHQVIDLNPVLNVAKDGTLLYSNETSEPLLLEWGVKKEEKLPSYLVDSVKRVLYLNSPEKMEVKTRDRLFLIVISPLPEKECVTISGFDISDQKDVEEKLRESENKYRNIVETSVEGIWIFNSVSETAYVNEKMAEMLGYSRKEMIGSFIWDYANEENKGFFQIRLANRKQGIDEAYEVKLIRKDGSPILFSVSAKGFFDNAGKFEGSVGMFTDITDRRRAEEALRESKARIESIFRSSPVGIGVVVDRMIKEANDKLCEMTGYSKEELLGKSALMLYQTVKEFERVGSIKYGMIDESGTGYIETQWQRKDGSVIDIFLSSSPIVPGDPSGEITFTAMDITKRKHAEEALKKAHETLEEKVKERTVELEKAYNSLKESEKGLAEAQKMAHIGNWEWDIATDKAYWSEEMYRIFGRDPQKLAPSYKEYLSYIHPDDLEKYLNATNNTRKISSSGVDFRIILASGEERTLHIKSEFIFNDENIPIRVKGIVQDITESKKAEGKIRYLANIVESSLDAIGTISLDGIITSWNKGAERIYGYSEEEILGKHVSILSSPHLATETMRLIKLIKKGEIYHQYETLRLGKDGKKIYVSIIYSPIFDNNGKLTAISVIGRDITERKIAEETLANIESARKKEIHHRIKNNLQVISSLLELQAEKFSNKEWIKNSEVLEAFKESQDRVVSMALIHEELYKGGDADTINFSQYINELAESLLQTYRIGNRIINLKLNLQENVFFGIDTAIPMGIIVNELVSNSLKYAFLGRNNGEIRINLYREENREYRTEGKKSTTFTLSISDNGVGIPKNLDIENLDSLGLQLVTSLVDQLDGELELKRNKGTEFTIKFTVTDDNNQYLMKTPQLVDND